MHCLLCEDSGWVCENHRTEPWEGPHACVRRSRRTLPGLQRHQRRRCAWMPGGFKIEVDKDGWRH